MKASRKIIFWIHLATGLAGGLVILIMCVTGALLAFEKNIIEFTERDARTIKTDGLREMLPISELLASVKRYKPDAEARSIAVTNDRSSAATVSVGRDSQVFVNPYTGEITGESSTPVRSFFRTVTELHRFLAFSGDGRPLGKALTGAANLMFLLLAVSGLYIWMPRRLEWRRIRPVFWFRKGVKGKARDFNWHATIGFWSSGGLVVLTLTATVISYQWASNLVFTLTGNQPPPAGRPAMAESEAVRPLPSNLDTLWKTAESQSDGWKSVNLRLPVGREAVFTIDEGKSWNAFGRSTLTLDAATGAATKWEPYADQNSGRQLRSWMRFTHTGETGGIFGQIIAFAASVGGAFLVYTGFSLAFRRFENWQKRQAGKAADGFGIETVRPEKNALTRN